MPRLEGSCYVNRPRHQEDAVHVGGDPQTPASAIEVERMDRVRAVWRGAEPSAFEVAAAEQRLASRRRESGRAGRSTWLLAVPAAAAAVLLAVHVGRQKAPAIAPVSEIAPVPVAVAPAGSAPEEAAAEDARRLDAAEALHRA